ncbi:MAG: o-succinylbenzoate synthase [Actinomycetota bacterium]
MRIDLFPYSLPLRSPMATAHRVVTERNGALLRLTDTDTDVVGWGDACPMPGWSSHDLSTVLQHLDDVVDVAAALPLLESVPEARAALAGAMADLDARRTGVSLAKHLGDAPLEAVAVNATIGAADVSTALTAVNLAVANGIDTVKLKVAHRSLDADLALIEGTRRAIGPDGEIRLDANGGWRPEEAAEALLAAEPYDIAFCEEPTTGIDAIAALASVSPVPLAVDESARTAADFSCAIAAGIDVIVVKPQAVGGPDVAMRIVQHAHEASVTTIITSMIDSAIGVAHAVHVAAASGIRAAHGVATSTLLASDVAPPLRHEEGTITVPTNSGLGRAPFGLGNDTQG